MLNTTVSTVTSVVGLDTVGDSPAEVRNTACASKSAVSTVCARYTLSKLPFGVKRWPCRFEPPGQSGSGGAVAAAPGGGPIRCSYATHLDQEPCTFIRGKDCSFFWSVRSAHTPLYVGPPAYIISRKSRTFSASPLFMSSIGRFPARSARGELSQRRAGAAEPNILSNNSYERWNGANRG